MVLDFCSAEILDINRVLLADWFFAFDILGTLAFALWGVLESFKRQCALMGTFLLAFFPSVGGGILRDLLLERFPLAFLSTPLYLICIVGCVLFVFLLKHVLAFFGKELFYEYPAWVQLSLHIMAGLGLASFTVLGVSVALLRGYGPLWFWGPFFAALTSCGGGLLSNLFCEGRRALYAKNPLPVLALIWGFIFSLSVLLLGNCPSQKGLTIVAFFNMMGVFCSYILSTLWSRGVFKRSKNDWP